MPSTRIKAALHDAPRKLLFGVVAFAIFKMVFVGMYGGAGTFSGPLALLLGLAAIMTRRVLWARVLGVFLLVNAVGTALQASATKVEGGPGIVLAITAAVATAAGWASFKYAKSLKATPTVRSEA